jgi:hypothetical protein
LRACFARVMSVHMCISVDASQHRLNHKSLISPNFIMRQTLSLTESEKGLIQKVAGEVLPESVTG